MPRDRQKLAVDVPFSIFVNEAGFHNEVRRATLDRVAVSMLRVVHTSALTEFFMDHIKHVMSVIEAKPSKVSQGHERHRGQAQQGESGS